MAQHFELPAFDPRSPGRPGGFRQQIDIGTYIIRDASGNTIMEVLVTVDPDHSTDPSYYIEHYGLMPRFSKPSSANTPATWVISYNSSATYSTESAFRSYLQGISGSIYLKAKCHEESP